MTLLDPRNLKANWTSIIGELDTIYIIEWLARACTVKDINYGMMGIILVNMC